MKASHRTIRPQLPRLFSRVLWALIYLLPVVLFFSYHPVISLGANSTMNFELSLPLIWLVVFDIAAFVALILLQISVSRLRRQSDPHFTSWGYNFTGISDRRIFLWSLLPFYATISAFWSANPLRALLTAGIIWLIFFAVFAILYILPLLTPSAHFRRRLFAVFFGATAVVCVFCFVQSLLDLCGVGRDTTLLCAGCTYRSFGFPHPSGFAIEPQFMGNLLLAPTLCALYFLVFRAPETHNSHVTTSHQRTATSHRRAAQTQRTATGPQRAAQASPLLSNRPQRIILMLCAALFSLTLFFTFSRGAIYAYAVALLVLLIFALRRHLFRPSLLVIPLVTFGLALGLQGTMAALGPTSETFVSGVTKSLHHLSLGIIDLRPQDEQTAAPSTSSTLPTDTPSSSANAADSATTANLSTLPETAAQPVFDGYVAESTDTRLELSAVALATWSSQPLTFLFGVGLGGAGTAMHDFAPTIITSAKEIVQNEPISLLLELGLVGALLIIFTLFLAFCPHLFSPRFLDGRDAINSTDPTTDPASPTASSATTVFTSSPSRSTHNSLPARFSPFWSHPALPLLAALLLAYLVTLQFFSGLPNALQIYLLPPLLYFALSNNSPEH